MHRGSTVAHALGVPRSQSCERLCPRNVQENRSLVALLSFNLEKFYEELKVAGKDLVNKVKHFIHEGNVRRVIVRDDKGHTFVEIPLWKRNYVSEGGGSMNLGDAIPAGRR